MIRLLLVRAMGGISTGALYYLWVRASAATLLLWAATLAADSWIAQTGLTVLLLILLVGGIVLFTLGLRDLVRDFRRLVRLRSEKRGHA